MLGQIGCDSNGKLNSKSVILEGDREHSSGTQIPVDLSELKEYSLFPGQVRLEPSGVQARAASGGQPFLVFHLCCPEIGLYRPTILGMFLLSLALDPTAQVCITALSHDVCGYGQGI